MTIQKFYRINGGSTQLEGVQSDIAMPDRYAYMSIGERDFENPLPYDQIKPAEYASLSTYENKELVIQKSKSRIASDEQFKLIDNFAKWTKENSDDNVYSLSFNRFKEEAKEHELEAKQFDSVYKFDSKFEFYSPQSELPLISADSILGMKRENWHNSLKRDIYVTEALRVLSDLEMESNTVAVKN